MRTTPTTRQRMRDLRAQGATYQQIADDVGYSVATVCRHVRDVLVPGGSHPGRGGYQEGVRERATRLRAVGYTLPEISETLGVSVRTLSTWDLPARGELRHVREARELAARGLTRPEIADRLDVPLRTVQSWALDCEKPVRTLTCNVCGSRFKYKLGGPAREFCDRNECRRKILRDRGFAERRSVLGRAGAMRRNLARVYGPVTQEVEDLLIERSRLIRDLERAGEWRQVCKRRGQP